MIIINQQTSINNFKADDFIELLTSDSDEDIYFDFKAYIEPKTEDDSYKIRKAGVSFANTFGGFLFFGILDKKNAENKKGMDRLIGIDKNKELGPYFTQKYFGKELCVPMIHFEGPRILEVNQMNIAIFKFLSSELKPHAIRKQIDSPLEFWARGSGTVRPINYHDLITELESSREQRGWLNALFIDLDSLIIQANRFIQNKNTEFFLPELLWSLLSSNYADVLRVIIQDSQLIQYLWRIRSFIENINTRIDYLKGISVLPINNNKEVFQENNNVINEKAKKLIELCSEVKKYLIQKYPEIREFIVLLKQQEIIKNAAADNF